MLLENSGLAGKRTVLTGLKIQRDYLTDRRENMGFMINSGHLKLACDALRRYYSSKDYVVPFETEKLE